ncbi:MAG: hypothetical protein ACK4ZE_00485 [Sphingorhabdus sp.]
MDNILKMLLGVLSVAGLIALVIPQKNPVAVNETANAATAEVNAPQPESTPPPPAPSPAPFDSGASVEFITGAPTIDGNPIQPDFGMPFGSSPQSDTANPDAPQTNQGGYTPTAFGMPGAPAPEDDEPAISVTLTR